jgi:hypothetical protein
MYTGKKLKMKLILFLILILTTMVSVAQVKDTVANPTVENGSIIVYRVGIDRLREEMLRKYSDSINEYKGGRLPVFLLDRCFDLRSTHWFGCDTPISLRWCVLERVNNKEALERILKTKDSRLKVKCVDHRDRPRELKVEKIKKSFFDLLNERYLQL